MLWGVGDVAGSKARRALWMVEMGGGAGKGKGMRTLCNQISLSARDGHCQAVKHDNHWLMLSCYVASARIWKMTQAKLLVDRWKAGNLKSCRSGSSLMI